MGALSGLGQEMAGLGGAGTASSLASSSMGWGAAGTLLGSAGSLMEGLGGAQQANFAAQVADRNAQAALLAGGQAESASKMKYGALAAQQKADFAGNGVSVGSQAVEATVNSTHTIGAIDASIIHYNAAREAWGAKNEAAVDRSVASNSVAKGLLGAGTSFLSGSSGLSAKWLAYKQSGAFNVPGSSASAAYDYDTMGA